MLHAHTLTAREFLREKGSPMRLFVLRSAAASVMLAAMIVPGSAHAETLAQCQAWGDAIPPASVAACTSLYQAAIAARAQRSMYEVDPSQLPMRLSSTRSEDMTTGGYDEFDKRRVRERSSDLTYRTIDALAVRTDASSTFESAFPWLVSGSVPIVISPIASGGLASSYPGVLADFLAVPAMGLPLGFVDPLTFSAHPSWVTRGDTFLSCKEYVWKRYYSHSRFVDSARACGNDVACIDDVVFATPPPGIAYAPTTDINGKPSPAQLKLLSGAPSKNLFFATSPWYLRDQHDALVTALAKYQVDEDRARNVGGCAFMSPGPYAVCSDYLELTGPTHQNDDVAAKAAIAGKMAAIDGLLRKKLFYSVGTSMFAPLLKLLGGTEAERFPTEWDFHAAMRARQTVDMTVAERRAIEERTAYLEKLVTAYVETTSLRACRAPAVAQGPSPGDLIAGGGGDLIDVIDIGSPDPWVRRWAIGSLSTGLVSSGSTLVSPIGLVEGTSGRIDVPSLVGKDVQLPKAFAAIPGGQIVAAVKSNRTKMAAPTPAPVDTQTDLKLMSGNVAMPGVPKLTGGGMVGVLPAGLSKLIPAATCDADVSKKDAVLSPRLSAVLARATAIQQEIADLLVQEYDRGAEGCLSEASYRCDWSPALLAARFVEQLASDKQSTLGECLAYTGGGNLAEATARGENKVSRFDDYVAFKKKADIASLEELPSRKVGDQVVAGDADHGDFMRGDDQWFGAGYTYDIGWQLDPVHPSGSGNRQACGVLAEAHGRFEAHASILDPIIDPVCPDMITVWPAEGSQILGNTPLSALSAGIEVCKLHARLKHLIDVNASVTTAADAATDATRGHFGGEVMVANERLFSLDGTFAVPTVQEGETVLFNVDGVVGPPPIETERASVTVVIVVVPVTVQAWGELHVGAEVKGKAHQVAHCTSGPASFGVKTMLGFAPFAKGTARASVAIGVSGLQAGVRGSVTLVDARLPIEGSLVANLDGAGLTLQPKFDARLNATFLSGSLSAFAEVGYKPFRYTAEQELYTFDGFQRNLDLWHLEPKPIVITALGTETWDKWTAGRASGASP